MHFALKIKSESKCKVISGRIVLVIKINKLGKPKTKK